MVHRRLASLALLLATAPGFATQADATAPEPKERFQDELSVRVINLEVRVEDARGEAVSGLGIEDFEVLVGGDPVEIHYFSEARAEHSASLESLEAGTVEPRAPANYLVFVDNVLTLARNRDFVLEFVREQLEEMRPGDRMAIVAYDGDRLHVLAPWTSSHDQLEQALDRASEDTGWGIRYIALRRMEDYVANWEGRATRRSVQAVAAGLHALPAPEGRKILLLVAGSWDPSEVGTASNFSDWCVMEGGCQGTRIFTALTDAANRLGYSIFAVDVEGRDPNQNWSREKRIQELLGRLADETGGRVLLNKARRQMLSEAVAEASSYYSIGLQLAVADDAQRRGIDVRVRQPGFEVRSRKSFVPLPEERERELEIFHQLLLGSTEEPPFSVEFGSPRRKGLDYLEIPAEIRVPIAQVEWLPVGADLRAQFEVELLVLDPKGRSSAVATREIELVRQNEPSELEEHAIDLSIVARKKSRNLGVAIRDRQSEESWFGVLRLPTPGGARDND